VREEKWARSWSRVWRRGYVKQPFQSSHQCPAKSKNAARGHLLGAMDWARKVTVGLDINTLSTETASARRIRRSTYRGSSTVSRTTMASSVVQYALHHLEPGGNARTRDAVRSSRKPCACPPRIALACPDHHCPSRYAGNPP
jgi:hypothetical protein